MEQKNETKGKIMITKNHEILKLVSEETGVPPKIICGVSRKHGVVLAKDLYINILNRCLFKTEEEISRGLAIKREAVHNGKWRHESRMNKNPFYRHLYYKIRAIGGFDESI